MPELWAVPSTVVGAHLLGSMDASLVALLRGRTPDAVWLELDAQALPQISEGAQAAYVGRWLTEARQVGGPETWVLVTAPFRLGAVAACGLEISGWRWVGTLGDGSRVVQVGRGASVALPEGLHGAGGDGAELLARLELTEGLVLLPRASGALLASLSGLGYGWVARCEDPQGVAEGLGASPASSSEVWMASFLALLRRGLDVNVAAERAGVSRSMPYLRRKEDAGFAAAWDVAVGRRVGG